MTHPLACLSVEHDHVSCIVAAIAEGFPREKWCEVCRNYYSDKKVDMTNHANASIAQRG